MDDKAIVVISFEGPDRFKEILQKVKVVFEDDDTVNIYGAVREVSQEVLNILVAETSHQSEREHNG